MKRTLLITGALTLFSFLAAAPAHPETLPNASETDFAGWKEAISESLSEGESATAEQLMRQTAMLHPDSAEASEARKMLLDLLWKQDRYDEYLSAADEIPERIDGWDAGESDLRGGYAAIRLGGDLARAGHLFQKASQREGAFGIEASYAFRWVGILESMSDEAAASVAGEEPKSAFDSLIRETQGGVEKRINAYDLGRRTYQYAKRVESERPEEAILLYELVSGDPLFGKYSVAAAYETARLSGRMDPSIESAWNGETAAFSKMAEALRLNREGELENALQKLDELLQDHSSSATARDAHMRKGYMLCNVRRFQEAADEFSRSLEFNSDLGPSHPFNLEAVARLYNLRHAIYYESRGVSADPSRDPNSLPHLNEIMAIHQEWIRSLPDGSPDREVARLEEAGLIFEQAVGIGSADLWESVRRHLRDELADKLDASQDVRCVAELMYLESYHYENRHDKILELVPLFVERYPGYWRELGTAKVYEWVASDRLGKRDSAAAAIDWIRNNVPSGAPTFSSCNYHVAVHCHDALEAVRRGDKQAYLESLGRMREIDPQSSYYLLAIANNGGFLK